MANIKSAKKRALVTEKKTAQNKSKKSRMNSMIKKFNEVVSKGDVEGAKKLLPEVVAAVDHACSEGIIHKNNASNKKAKFLKTIHQLESGKFVVRLDAKTAKKQEQKAAAARKAEEKAKEMEALKEAKAKKEAEKAEKAEKKAPAKKSVVKKIAEKVAPKK